MLDPSFLRRVGPIAALATELAVLTAGSLLLGSWLDNRFGTSPWLLLVLTLLGFLAGIFRLVQGMARFQEDDDEPPNDSA